MTTDSFDVTILLDRSGSMQSIKGDMEGALVKFVSDQAAIPGRCLLSVYKFDEKLECEYSAVDVRDAKPIKLEPRGCTALLDSMARVIDQTGARLAAMSDADRPKRVVFTVITDGMENASREFDMKAIRERVERQTKDYSWEFVFFGAGLDSFHQGAALGVAASANYVATSEGVQFAMDSYSSAMTNSRSTGMAFNIAPDLTVKT